MTIERRFKPGDIVQIRTDSPHNTEYAPQGRLMVVGYDETYDPTSLGNDSAACFLAKEDGGHFVFDFPEGDEDRPYDNYEGVIWWWDNAFELVKPERETITVGDAVYDKAEFEEATRNLRRITDV